MPTAALVNSTGHQAHFGCKVVGEVLDKEFARRDMELKLKVPCGKSWKPYGDDLKKVDLIVVNGEGSLHHNRPKYLELLELASVNKVVLVNSIFQAIPEPNAKLLSRFKLVSLRESLSRELAKKYHPGAIVTPDVFFLYNLPEASLQRLSAGIGFFPAVGEQLNCDHDLDAADPNVISKAASYSRIVTGRFHGICLSAMMGKPFSGYTSNSWKNLGIMTDMGAEGLYWESRAGAHLNVPSVIPKSVIKYAVDAWARIHDMFDRILDIAKGKK